MLHANGHAERWRAAYIGAAGHGTFSHGEIVAGIETMMRRRDLGQWRRWMPRR
jgi:hypothetical protein